MSDEQHVDAGSETSGETAAETTSTEQSATEETTSTDTTETAQAGTAAESAEGAADADESRTAFVTGARPSEECICPDGRKGTVHKFDEGLVCIPNADQG